MTRAHDKLAELYASHGITVKTEMGARGVERKAVVACPCGAKREYRCTRDYPAYFLVDKFTEFNWQNHQRSWRCPTCIEKQKGPKMTQTPAQPAPAPQPTIKQTVAIDAALCTHFDKDTGAFRNGMTDEKIATQLNLPRILVSIVREQAHGPLKVPTELSDLKSQITTISGLVTELSGRVNNAIAKYQR